MPVNMLDYFNVSFLQPERDVFGTLKAFSRLFFSRHKINVKFIIPGNFRAPPAPGLLSALTRGAALLSV